MKKLRLKILILILSLVSNIVSANDNWDWSVEPYLMAANMTGTTGVGRIAGVGIDVDTKALLENFKMGAMLHAEALRNDGWGFMFDYSFLRLGDDIDLPRGGIVDATVRQGILEAFLFKRQTFGTNTLDIYGGIRWWDNDIDVDIDLAILPRNPSINIEEDWVDPVIGTRYFHPFNEKWTLAVQGDIAGFGVSSDIYASASLGAIYQLSGSTKIDIKYKGIWADYESGQPGQPGFFRYDVTTHGPIVGIIFEF